MKEVIIEGNRFISVDLTTAKVIFSTGENDFNLNKNINQGIEHIKKIKGWFSLEDVAYLSQCHSDYIHIYPNIQTEGDALITNVRGVAVGIFTADCVPVLIFDEENKAVAAIHSGWRGTYNKIVSKTIDKMTDVYGSKVEDIKVFIGPHMRDCCYEVGQELMDKFNNDNTYKNHDIFNGKKLSMEKCIIKQLKDKSVPDKNIVTLNYCTFCSTNPRFYSYRRGEKDKRLFSFIYIK